MKASLVDSETERARLVETLDADVRRRAECVEEGKQRIAKAGQLLEEGGLRLFRDSPHK